MLFRGDEIVIVRGHGTMITSLAELLEEEVAITQEEWEQKIQKNLRS